MDVGDFKKSDLQRCGCGRNEVACQHGLHTVSGKKGRRTLGITLTNSNVGLVLIFARNIIKVMRNYLHNKRPRHLVTVATLPCELLPCIAKHKVITDNYN